MEAKQDLEKEAEEDEGEGEGEEEEEKGEEWKAAKQDLEKEEYEEEEEKEDVDLDQECDLVGISCMTANAPRAYDLCHEFRKRGKSVVLGGVHPSILPDEAMQHANSVVIGEAEGVWETLIKDFLNNNLQRRYHNPMPDLTKYVTTHHYENPLHHC